MLFDWPCTRRRGSGTPESASTWGCSKAGTPASGAPDPRAPQVKTDSVNTRKLRRRWGQGFGKMNAEGSLMWSRHRDEHQSRYILETYREKQTNAFESALRYGPCDSTFA